MAVCCYGRLSLIFCRVPTVRKRKEYPVHAASIYSQGAPWGVGVASFRLRTDVLATDLLSCNAMCFVPRVRCSLDAFSDVLHKCCSERELLATPDVAHLLSMSVVMLNTRYAPCCASPTLQPRMYSSL